MNQQVNPKQDNAMNNDEVHFTPSELVLLNGERFSPKAKLLNKTRLIHNGQEVACTTLVERMLAGAILATEQRQVNRLEIRQKKGLLGLGKVNALYLEPTGRSFGWPDGTVEAELCRRAPLLKANKARNEVYNLVYEWMGSDSNNPWDQVVTLVQSGLAQRGLLDIEEKKVLLVFKSQTYVFPQRTAELLNREDPSGVQRALDACEQGRPDIWKMLIHQIGRAVKARTEQTDASVND